MAFDPELWTNTETALTVIDAAQTSPVRAAKASGTATITSAWDGKVKIPDSHVLRHWARGSEWIKGAIGIRKSQVSSAEWDIVPLDATKRHAARQQELLRAKLRRPNTGANDTWRSFIEPVIEDLITLDAGCIEKERTVGGGIAALWPVDAAKIKVNAMWDGSNPETPRYFWYPDGWQEAASFANDDFIYMMQNKRTDSPIGFSPLQTLRATIEAEMMAHEYNRRQVAGAAPDGVLNLGEGMTEVQARQFASYFESEVAGRGAIGFLAGVKNPSWIPFRENNRDMQFLEWQIYLVRKICIVLGLTPQDLGVTFDINRSTAETQIQISEDRGLRPLMTLIQEYITEEIVWDKAFGGPDNNLAFRFTALNLRESTAKANIYKLALGGVPWRFINEARIEEGREPIPELDGKLIMATPTGAVNIMDVPTVREQMDAQLAAKQKPAPAASQSAVTPVPMIEAGAIQVKVDNHQPPVKLDAPVTIEQGAIRIETPISVSGAPEFLIEKESEEIPDPAVVEAERRAADEAAAVEAQRAAEAEAKRLADLEVQRRAEAERLAEEAASRLLAAQQAAANAAKTRLRRVVLRDDNGRVTGVREELLTASGAVKSSTQRMVVRDERGHITEVIEE